MAVPDDADAEARLAADELLEQLRAAGISSERFDAWQTAGELQEGKWVMATFLLEPDVLLAGDQGSVRAMRRFGATHDLVERLLEDRMAGVARTYVNPAGGAPRDGVESLNDIAWAAARLEDAGLQVAVVDLDARHAAETEQFLRETSVVTVSIHDRETARTTYSDSEKAFVNVSLGSGTGDMGLVRGVQAACSALEQLEKLDVLVLVASTNGLEVDSSSSLAFTPAGFEAAAVLLGQLVGARRCSVLVAGGVANLPDSVSPQVWASLVAGLVGPQVVTAVTHRTTPVVDTIEPPT